MTLRRSLWGAIALALLAVAFSSVNVVSAAASTTEECKIPEEGEKFTSGHFLDENCEKKSGAEGLYHTTLVKETSILETTKTTPIWWYVEFPAAATAKISCEEVGGKKTVSDFEEGEKHFFKGEGVLEFTGCAVNEPAECSISSTIETTNLSITSEDLAEVQRTLYAPKVGTKLGSFTIAGCAIAGTYTIEGKLRSQTVNIHTEEFGPKSGSELVISKSIPLYPEYRFHEVTAGTKKFITRELP